MGNAKCSGRMTNDLPDDVPDDGELVIDIE